jgi:hypothetical protein
MSIEPSDWTRRLDELVALLQVNEISEEQAGELNRLLDSQKGARRRFAEHMQLATLLSDATDNKLHSNVETETTTVRESEQSGRSFPRILKFALATAAIALIVISVWPRGERLGTTSFAANEPLDEGVAVVTNAVNAKFSAETLLEIGDSVSPGRVVLDSGHVQFEFYRGAIVVVEGPAELEFINADQMVCQRGRLRAHVPPQAEGFAVLSPSFELVDLGTEFGVDVAEDGSGSIRVFEGKVEVYEVGSNRSEESRREIGEDSGATISVEGDVTATETPDGEFLSSDRLRGLKSEHDRARFLAWQKHSRALSNDPRVIVHHSFDPETPATRSLTGHAAGEPSIAAAIVGCSWSQGRWQNKGALEFKHPGDRVRTSIPGEYTSVTWSAWVRLDGLDRPFISLMLTNGYDAGEAHWQLREDGRLLLGVKSPSGHVAYDSQPALSIKDLGRWVHLSTVYDGESRTVSHYIDGENVGTSPVSTKPFKLKFGDTEIGNWGTPVKYSPQKIRNLNGRIDQVTLFREALSEDEIAKLYAAGKK